jgi:iron complex outermembrane recepter protein
MSKHLREEVSNKQKKEQITFRRTAIAIAITSFANFSALPAYAADDQALAELQKALEQLKAENDNLKKQLANKPVNSTDDSTNTTTTGTATEENKNSDAKTAATEDPSALDAIIVKFKKKKSVLEKVKDEAKSISIVSGEELEQQGALNVTDIFKRIGNVQWNYGNPKTGSLSIRGVSAGSSEAIDPSLGVNVDGVPYAYVALASGSDYIDIDTVDVTRGPQGSTGGKNTSMGTINITTKRPTFTPEANASVTFGQRNALITQAAVGGAIVDDVLAWRGTFYRNQQEGYYKNEYKDIEDRTSYVNTDRTYGRLQFLLTPTEDFDARVSLDFKPKGTEFVNGVTVKGETPGFFRNGAPYNYVGRNDNQVRLSRGYFTSRGYGFQDYLKDPVNEDQNKGIMNGSKGASAELNWKVLGDHNFKSISAWKDNFFQASNDEGTPFDITKNSGLYVDYEQLSQEFRLSSAIEPGSLVDYTGGLFYINTKSNASSRTRFGADAGAWNATNAQYYGGSASNAIVPAVQAGGLAFDSAGQQLMRDSLDRVFFRTRTFTDNTSIAGYAQADWHLTDKITLTTGARLTDEDRSTSQVKETLDPGVASALNPVANGGFVSNAATGVVAPGTNTPAQQAQADLVAQTYFGAANYGALNANQLSQVAKAKAIRAAQAYNGNYGKTKAEGFNDVLKTGNVSLSYKFNDDLTTYVSYQRGAKAGISQISGRATAQTLTSPGTGSSALAAKETSNAYEIGIKGTFFDKTLSVNADVFLDNLKDYQTTVSVFDPLQAIATPANPYISLVGNAPLVRIKGLEVDATYNGIEYVSLRFAGAYNDARYESGTRLANPVEDGNLGVTSFDASGQTLPNAPKFTGNLSAEYRRPILGNKEFHTNINYNYSSKYKSDASLSDYSEIDAVGITDFGIGIGRQDKLFDANILVKNLFDTSYRNNQTWNSYVPTVNPRWIGIVFTGRL